MIGIDPLDIKAMQDHADKELRRAAMDRQQKLQSAVLVKVCGDVRLAEIVKVFEAGDTRRKETMYRMACALNRVGV